jgi:ABC-2 type transport system ATP-binding protein
MECIEGLRTPDRGAISVLGLDPFRQAYKLQDRIGVQLQQAQLQKRIKVWEAADLWASLYQKRAIDADRLPVLASLLIRNTRWRRSSPPIHGSRGGRGGNVGGRS